jgi:cytochrome c5
MLFPLLLLAASTACGKQESAPPPAQSALPPTSAAEYAPPTPAQAMPEASAVQVAQAGGAGKKVYDSACTACHAAGVAGAPKLGDKAAWSPRIAQGMDMLYTHSIKGFTGKAGMMPPKGGFMNLSDADVKAAVDYMVSKAK